MLDINLVRTNPELVKASEKRRGQDPNFVDVVLSVDSQWRLKLKEVEKFDVSENPREDIKRLKEFSEKWNSIGFVPKQDIQIKDKFDKVISSLYNKLKVDKSEKKTIQFQIKAERLKGNSNKLNVEKELIREEIGKVNKTILQYENNISFFGNGKGTEKLKEDVLKNIENSKKEIEELKKKLSLLNKI